MSGTAEGEMAGGDVELTDGFHLLIDAMKLNGLETIYGVPGIPITDFGRMAQAAGIRVLSFRHEQNAGNAAAIAGYLTQKPGVCLTVSAPGFLNGLTALAHATTNCWPMILMSGSSEREIVDLQQGDYEEMDQLAIAKPLCKAAYRILHAEDIGIGLARAIRAAVSGRPGGVYLDLPASLFGQTMEAAKGAPHKALNLGLAAATIVISWTVTQVVFTLHYAHEYYRPTGGHETHAQGLDFRGDRNPDYWDFFYFATSFGAASQTSDVTILTKPLRRLATLHAIISFFFNTAVLALTINLAASLI